MIGRHSDPANRNHLFWIRDLNSIRNTWRQFYVVVVIFHLLPRCRRIQSIQLRSSRICASKAHLRMQNRHIHDTHTRTRYANSATRTALMDGIKIGVNCYANLHYAFRWCHGAFRFIAHTQQSAILAAAIHWYILCIAYELNMTRRRRAAMKIGPVQSGASRLASHNERIKMCKKIKNVTQWSCDIPARPRRQTN